MRRTHAAVVLAVVLGCGPAAGTGGTTQSDPAPDTTDMGAVASSSGATTDVEPHTSSSSSSDADATSSGSGGDTSSSRDTSSGRDSDAETGRTCDAVVMCRGEVFACGDLRDNDGDGLADMDDPDCLGPCDADESTFFPAMTSDALDCARDCYFDDNAGQGDDGCNGNPACDPLNPGASIGCPYTGGGNCPPNPSVSRECVAACEPLTPNGCDCYGCCTLLVDGELVDLFLGASDCGSATPESCPPCTQRMEDCGNPCESDVCEICIGQTEPLDCKAPADCDEGFACDDNCDCPDDYFCLQGCCYPPPPGG